MRTYIVAAGVVIENGKVLLSRRKEGSHLAGRWEFPGGKAEAGEDPRAALRRELEEELGFALAPSALAPLGPPAFPAPALIGELHYFYHVEVDPALRATPGGDGSALEEAATIAVVTLEDLLAACRRGDVPDAKTELGLRRLADIL